MDNVFLFPADGGGTARPDVTPAAEEGRELESLLPLIRDENQREDLRRCHPDGRCYPWGVRETGGNRSAWEMMAPGDLVLGCRDRSIVSAAFVRMKLHHPALAARLWGDPPGGPYALIVFSDRPHVGEVPIVPQMHGYLELDVRGFSRLDPEKRDRILRGYGSLETFVRLGLRYDFPFSFRHSE